MPIPHVGDRLRIRGYNAELCVAERLFCVCGPADDPTVKTTLSVVPEATEAEEIAAIASAMPS